MSVQAFDGQPREGSRERKGKGKGNKKRDGSRTRPESANVAQEPTDEEKARRATIPCKWRKQGSCKHGTNVILPMLLQRSSR